MKNTKNIGKAIDKIRLVELELTSQCNRTCGFCPNSYIDRHSENHKLNKHVFENLIQELARNNYSKFISFSRYNEPFMHRNILEERIRYIRMNLPNVTLVSNTNGDFSTLLVDIDQLTVMDYDNNKQEICTPSYRVMKLGPINNRGGALDIKSKRRDFPCYEPTYFVGVDYTGDVMPCCNLRHDVKEHKPFILGNLNKNSLEEILNSNKAIWFRKAVASGKQKYFPSVCKECLKEEGRYTRNNPSII